MRIKPGQLSFFGNQLFQETANIIVAVPPDHPGLIYKIPGKRLISAIPGDNMINKIKGNKLVYKI